jgi:hypothetical protein
MKETTQGKKMSEMEMQEGKKEKDERKVRQEVLPSELQQTVFTPYLTQKEKTL